MKERFVSTQNWNQKFVASQKYEGMSCPPPPLSLPSLSSPSSLFSSWFLRTLSGMAALKIHLDITSTKCRRESIERKSSVQGRIQEIGIVNETPVNHHMSDSIPSSSSNSIRIIRIPMIQIQQRSFSMQEKFLSYISSLECSPIPSTIHTVRKDSGTCIILSSEFESFKSCGNLKNLDPVCATGDGSDLTSDLLSNQLPENVIVDVDLDVVPVESYFSDELALSSYRPYKQTNDVDEFSSDSYQYTGNWKNIGPAKTIVPFSGGDGRGMNSKYLLYM